MKSVFPQGPLPLFRRTFGKSCVGLFVYMFVVSGHLYRPLPSSQPCGLRVKIKDNFGTRPPDVFRCRVKHPRVPLTPKPVGSAMWRGLRNRSNTYSFALRASPTPFAHVLTLIYFGVGRRGERPWPLRPHLLQKGFVGLGGLQISQTVLKIRPHLRWGRC